LQRTRVAARGIVRTAEDMRARFTRPLFYLWAAPATFVGLCLAGVACALGASARVRRGVLEVAGGRLTPAAGAASGPLPFLAITFGHVVLGLSHEVLEAERAHEHAHVRQYERWGLLFIPLYLGSSAAQLAAGRHPYWHNVFEKQAFAAAAATPKE
jgi:hypothetical protein